MRRTESRKAIQDSSRRPPSGRSYPPFEKSEQTIGRWSYPYRHPDGIAGSSPGPNGATIPRGTIARISTQVASDTGRKPLTVAPGGTGL
jgi:hypothetical protein